METINKFNKRNLSKTRSDLDNLLNEYGKEHEMVFTLGNIRFFSDSFNMKIIATIANCAKDAEKKEFVRDCKLFGLTEEHYNKEITINNKTYKIIGIDKRKHKYPIICRLLVNDNKYKLSIDEVKRALGLIAYEPFKQNNIDDNNNNVKGLIKVGKIGTGESQCSTPKNTRIKFNDVHITIKDINKFLDYINERDISVQLSNRKTKNRWGTAILSRKEILLYRHSVAVFLHELAHVLCDERGHGRIFGRKLDELYEIWDDYIIMK